MEHQSTPISARFAQPWIDDNQQFVEQVVDEYTGVMERLRDELRPKLTKSRLVQKTKQGTPSPMAAVDAAIVDVMVDDMSTVLVQAAVHFNDKTHFDEPCRFGPFTSEDARYVRTPARVSRETAMFSKVPEGQIVIVDNSFWSFLMEVNQAVTASNKQMKGDEEYESIVENLVKQFTEMMENPSIIAMPKRSVSQSISKNPRFSSCFKRPIADKSVATRVLDEGEYLKPISLKDVGSFGSSSTVNVEMRNFTKEQVKRIKEIYEKELFFTYYKPWSYSRAYRVEARKERLNDDLFASIKEATKYREIAEPEPQFMVDHAVKQISHIQKLYGGLNRFRLPFTGFHRTAR